jgi:putative spermidine/putrescine transport system substrate-binding protein
MRRAITIVELLMIGALTAVISGCGQGGVAQTPAPTTARASDGAVGASDACNPPRQDGVTLTFVSFGGAYQDAQREAWLEPYTALTGVQFLEDPNSSNGTIRAQVETGQVTWDVVDVGNDFGTDAHADLLEPLDYSLIPRDEMAPDLGLTDYRVPVMTYGVVLAYNFDKTGGVVPTGWADYFDTTKFPGKRGAWDNAASGMFEFALMADGVAPADLYPLDLARATAKLDTVKDDIVLWTSGAQSRELIGSGELAMSMMWNGRAWYAIHEDNRPVGIQWSQQILTADFVVVPKGSPNKDAAMRFIAYMTCAANNARVSEFIPYGPTNVNSEPAPAMVPDLAVTNVDESTAHFDDTYLIDNFDEIDAAWQEWKTL